jgi:predicted ATPase
MWHVEDAPRELSIAYAGPKSGRMNITVTEAYEAAVTDGRLTRDPAQQGVLPELDRIRGALAAPVKTGLFRKAPPPIPGLYMWGGVPSPTQ